MVDPDSSHFAKRDPQFVNSQLKQSCPRMRRPRRLLSYSLVWAGCECSLIFSGSNFSKKRVRRALLFASHV